MQVDLVEGLNTVAVTSANGDDTRTYNVRINRADPPTPPVLFSAELSSLAVSYVTMRDGVAVFVQSPHRVVRAKRVEGRSDLWDITIRVGDDRRLSVTVFKGSGCDGEHAVCTADGRPVSQAAQVFIEGPSS
ncbi:hypothetical protein [Candidatus Poriferisodalis sp.]|uniref:hypothetical protein n=1 Tax=Candidatus Poriferisodalis sp. TaxID=3101277 RepID=UPI003B0166F1